MSSSSELGVSKPSSFSSAKIDHRSRTNDFEIISLTARNNQSNDLQIIEDDDEDEEAGGGDFPPPPAPPGSEDHPPSLEEANTERSVIQKYQISSFEEEEESLERTRSRTSDERRSRVSDEHRSAKGGGVKGGGAIPRNNNWLTQSNNHGGSRIKMDRRQRQQRQQRSRRNTIDSDDELEADGDEDSGCVLEDYAWVPQGLKPFQVLLYFSELDGEKVPYFNSPGEKYRLEQLRRQLPIQDEDIRFCQNLSPEEQREHRIFNAKRNRQSRGHGKARQLTLTLQSGHKCSECGNKIRGGDLCISASKSGPGRFWHPACFVCSVCKELLVDLIYYVNNNKATDSSNGNKFKLYCGRHHSETVKPRCFGCDEVIFSNECTEAEGKTWHVKHFTCKSCQGLLGGRRYIWRGDHALCVQCYNGKFAEICSGCKSVIDVDQGQMSYNGHNWHADCFKCNRCRRPLQSEPFLPLGNGQVYCSSSCAKEAEEERQERISLKNIQLQLEYQHPQPSSPVSRFDKGLPKKKKSSAVLSQQKKENYVVIQPGDFREDLGKFHKSSNVRALSPQASFEDASASQLALTSSHGLPIQRSSSNTSHQLMVRAENGHHQLIRSESASQNQQLNRSDSAGFNHLLTRSGSSGSQFNGGPPRPQQLDLPSIEEDILDRKLLELNLEKLSRQKNFNFASFIASSVSNSELNVLLSQTQNQLRLIDQEKLSIMESPMNESKSFMSHPQSEGRLVSQGNNGVRFGHKQHQGRQHKGHHQDQRQMDSISLNNQLLMRKPPAPCLKVKSKLGQQHLGSSPIKLDSSSSSGGPIRRLYGSFGYLCSGGIHRSNHQTPAIQMDQRFISDSSTSSSSDEDSYLQQLETYFIQNESSKQKRRHTFHYDDSIDNRTSQHQRPSEIKVEVSKERPANKLSIAKGRRSRSHSLLRFNNRKAKSPSPTSVSVMNEREVKKESRKIWKRLKKREDGSKPCIVS